MVWVCPLGCDENVRELDKGGGRTTLNILKATELYTLKE